MNRDLALTVVAILLSPFLLLLILIAPRSDPGERLDDALGQTFGDEAGDIIIRYERPYRETPEGDRISDASLFCGGIGRDPERPIAIVVQEQRRRGRGWWREASLAVTEYAISRPMGRAMTVRDVWFLARCSRLNDRP